MEILSFFKKLGLNFLQFLYKGARIDAALYPKSRIRLNTGNFYPKPDAIPILDENGKPYAYDADDVIRIWEITSKAILIIKNNSKFHAYNLVLVNAHEIFTSFQPLKKLTSLAPNEPLEIEVEFRQTIHATLGTEADKAPLIPSYIQTQMLKIQYENEAARKMYTHSYMSFNEISNQYSY